MSLLVVQFKGRAQPHLPQLGLVLRIPILDTVSKVQGSNGLRTQRMYMFMKAPKIAEGVCILPHASRS